MPMKPHKGESQSDFMSRCVPEMIGTGEDKRPQDQAVAICSDIWNGKGLRQLRQAPEPEDGEGEDDFMERCTSSMQDDGLSDDDAQTLCEIAWETGGGGELGARGVITKTVSAPVRDMMFTLSDETPDRYGDVVSAGGWELDNFRKNPIALFGHNPDFPIGRWVDLHIEDKALRGSLALAPPKTSGRIDEIRTLIKAGVLKAVSVGFRSLARPERMMDANGIETGGLRFLKHELLEASLVTIPANPNALAIAKALNVSPDTLNLVFAEPGDRHRIERRRATRGEVALIPPTRQAPMSLSQRIQDAQARETALRDRLTEHLRDIDDANPSEAEDAITAELNRQIGQAARRRAMLEEAERALAPDGGSTVIEHDPAERPSRALALVRPEENEPPVTVKRANGSIRLLSPRAASLKRRKELDPVDYLVRNGVITLFAHRLRKSADEVRQTLYGDDEMTKACFDYIQKTASSPAMTTVPGWAQELVTQIQGDYMAPLMPAAVFPRLQSRGLSLDFGTAGRIAIPTRSRTPTIAGSFVGEGQPIPVRQGAFTAQILTPKKLGVITVMTREIEQHSIPAIEGLLRDAISEDTGISIDSVLLDANPATQIRPPGLLNGVTATPPALVADDPNAYNRMVMDLKNLKAALTRGSSGNVRNPVWLMNPVRVDSIGLAVAPNSGVFPFKDEIEAGTLLRWPVIDSATIAEGELIAVDAADFVTAGQGAPTFEVSDQATLHMEDTTPLPIVDGGTPAAPTRSLWQTDSYALRLLMRLNWLMRRPMVAFATGLTW
jgi:HK97 family phage prohead protease